MSAMISLNKLASSNNISTNINVNIDKSDKSIQQSAKQVLDKQAPKYPTIISEEEYVMMKNECEVLKLIIDMYRSNPIKYNGYVIADDAILLRFIQLLTNADDVQLDVEEIGQGCFSNKVYRRINAIYVIKNNETKNLKYNCPGVMKKLTDLGISVKYVW